MQIAFNAGKRGDEKKGQDRTSGLQTEDFSIVEPGSVRS